MKILEVAIDKVKPYGKNPRKNARAISKVVESIKCYGFRQPIVVDKDNVVIVGHTRLEAAKQLGMTKVPIHVAEGLSAKEVKAYRIADNKTAEFAIWDAHKLEAEIADIDGLFTGFTQKELDTLFHNVDEVGVQDMPEKFEVIIVDVSDQVQQKSLFDELTGRGLKCRLVAI